MTRKFSGNIEHTCKCGNVAFTEDFSNFDDLGRKIMKVPDYWKCSCGREEHGIKNKLWKSLAKSIKWRPNQYVYITKYGKLFHRSGCGYLSRSRNAKLMMAGKAWEMGYDPCRCVIIKKIHPCLLFLMILGPILTLIGTIIGMF